MRTIDPIAQAEQAIAQAVEQIEACAIHTAYNALSSASEQLRIARQKSAASASRPARKPTNAHKIATAIAVEHAGHSVPQAAGMPLSDPTCRRIYIAAYETYTQAIAGGMKPTAARMAAHVAAEESLRA
jgi:hypothetical protein